MGILGRGPASPLVHPPPQLNKMGIIRKLRVSNLRCGVLTVKILGCIERF